ncbi:MAG: hypothetical protein AAFY66_07545 [Pseudomonadota bacterium]
MKRGKTDAADAEAIAEAVRSMCDLFRARWDAKVLLITAKLLLTFLLHHGRGYESGKKYWTLRHRHWLSRQTFDEATHRIVFQRHAEAV